MDSEDDKYVFPETINEQSRFIGLPYDELFIIASLVLTGITYNMTGTLSALAAFLWLFVRRLKKGQGSAWLLNLIYWYTPFFLIGIAFRKIPDSGNRHWMK